VLIYLLTKFFLPFVVYLSCFFTIIAYSSRLHRFSFLLLIVNNQLKVRTTFCPFFYPLSLSYYIVAVQLDKELPRNSITFTL